MAYYCRVERDSVYSVKTCNGTGDQTLRRGGNRLTSFLITFPRIVLAETVTHRMCHDTWGYEEVCFSDRTTDVSVSKNSASSRAIPLWKMIQKVMDDPYVPDRFSVNGSGMQGRGWLEGADHELAVTYWLDARDTAVTMTTRLLTVPDRERLMGQLPQLGRLERYIFADRHGGLPFAAPSLSVHKQDVNRLLEPWAWVTQVVTSSRWDNFFALRCDRAAHPAFQKIARMMFLARRKSTPRALTYGGWHLPFVPQAEQDAFRWEPSLPCVDLPDLLKFSAARCAWTSYENSDRESTPEKMLATYERLFGGRPVHASPLEHQATPMPEDYQGYTPQMCSNLSGWLQARKLIPAECVTRYDPPEEEVVSWGLEDAV
jgi:hypothetical protein